MVETKKRPPMKGHRICAQCLDGKVIKFGKMIDCKVCKGNVYIPIREKTYCEKRCYGYGSFACTYPDCQEISG